LEPPGPEGPAVIFRNGLRNGWQDFGWAPRDLAPGQPARVDFSGHGGWIIGGPEIQGAYGTLVLWIRAPAGYGDFLAVRLSGQGVGLPPVTITAEYRRAIKARWQEVRIPYADLNPGAVAFDTVTLSAINPVPSGWAYIDNIVLYPDGATESRPKVTGAKPASADDTADPMADVELERPNIIGLALHLGAGIPAGGGSAMFTAGLSARLSLADAYIGLGVRSSVRYHSLAVQAGDPTGTTIKARSQVVMLPFLGVLTLRLPLGELAMYGHVGCGGAWVWASRKTLNKKRSANTAAWAALGALGTELAIGPGWLGLEVGYLMLPSIELPDVLHRYQGDGLTVSAHYRLGK
jgi:hypothetical protein